MPDPPRLTKAALARLAARHEKVVAKVLASESIAMHVLSVPVAAGTRHLVEYIAGAVDPAEIKRAIYQGVQVVTPVLRDEFTTAVKRSRDHARHLSRLQAEQDLELFKSEAVASGLADLAGVARVQIPIRIVTADMDAALAAHAAGSMTQKWTSTMLGQHAKWKQSGAGFETLGPALRGTGHILEPRVYDHAIAHSIDPYADEHRASWRSTVSKSFSRPVEAVPYPIVREADMFDSGPTDGLAYGWGEGIFDVWSAILDRKTCPACGALDGTMVPAGKGWPGADRPPLHPPRCRCLPMTVFVPEAVSRKLPGIQQDYAALKQDVRDYMRGAALDIGAGRRNALPFIHEALAGRSPVVLSQRFSDRAAYFPNGPKARAPKVAR